MDRPLPLHRTPIDQPFERLGSGDLPVVVHVPHAGLHIPDGVRADILLDDEALDAELRRMTDHRTDVLATGAVAAGATAFVNRQSRLVVDPERFADPARETMESVGMGAVYTRTADGAPLRAIAPQQRQRLLEDHFHPYAEALRATVDDVLAAHGRVVLLDLHSYPRNRLAYELGGDQRPQLCVGTDPVHTPDELTAVVTAAARDRGWSVAHDDPFAGSYVPLDHLGDDRVWSVMLELRRDLHLDEARWIPGDESAATAFVTEVALSAGELDRDAPPTRLDPGAGARSDDPYSLEQLRQAQQDRLSMMGAFGMTEEDFGDAAIWLDE